MNLLGCLFWLTTVSSILVPVGETEIYFAACYNAAGNLYQFGVSCPAADAKVRTVNHRCPCKDVRFVETVVNCMIRVTRDYARGDPQVALNNSFAAFAAKCPGQLANNAKSFVSNSSSLLPYEGDKLLERPGSWSVTSAFALDDDEIRDSYMVLVKKKEQPGRNNRYGAGLLGFWAIVIGAQSFGHFVCYLFPTFWKKVQDTKIVRWWRATIETKPPKLGEASITQAILTILFVIVTNLFAFIDLGVWQPDNTVLYSTSAMIGYALASRAAVLAMYLLPLLVICAGRNNILIWVTGWPQEAFVFMHRWLSRAELVYILGHVIGISTHRAYLGTFSAHFESTFWLMGGAGVVLACFLVVQGIKFVRLHAYNMFVLIHFVVAVGFMAMVYEHIKQVGCYVGMCLFYATVSVWAFDRLLRFIRVVYSGFCGYQGKKRVLSFGIPANIEVNHETLNISFERPLAWYLIYSPGQIVFIHFLTGSLFWQSHPFVVRECIDKPGTMLMTATIHRGITKRLAQLVTERSEYNEQDFYDGTERCTTSIKVLLDGPYGVAHNFMEYEELIFIASDTGVSLFLTFIEDCIRRFPYSPARIYLFWTVSAEQEKVYQAELTFLQEYKNIEVHIHHPSDQKSVQRFHIMEKVSPVISHITGPTAVYTCGPTEMNKAVKRAVAKSALTAPHSIQLFEEPYDL